MPGSAGTGESSRLSAVLSSIVTPSPASTGGWEAMALSLL